MNDECIAFVIHLLYYIVSRTYREDIGIIENNLIFPATFKTEGVYAENLSCCPAYWIN